MINNDNHINNKQICKYYMKNQCKFGANCFYSHDFIPQSPMPRFNTVLSSFEDSHIPQRAITPSLALTSSSSENLSEAYSFDISNTPKMTLCKEFLIKACTNLNCPFYHGYSEQMLNISLIPCQSLPIVALCSLTKSEFASCDKTTVKLWKIEDKIKCVYQHIIDKGDIKKIVAIGNSLLFTVHVEEYLSECTILYLMVKSKVIQKTSKMTKINEITFYNNTLICFGVQAIEIYSVSNDALMLIHSIDITNEIVTVAQVQSKFYCGHSNGMMTVLKFNSQDCSFDQTNSVQLHKGRINKLLIKTVDSCSNYLISASEDKTIIVSNIEKGLVPVFMKRFNNQIENIFTSFDYNSDEVFCLCFDNGHISVLNSAFEGLFEITSHDNKKRFGINIANPDRNETNGHFLVLNDDNRLECNMWINPGSYNLLKNCVRKMSEPVPRLNDFFN